MEQKLEKPLFKHLSVKEWYLEGCKRYGVNQRKWKFRCPSCGCSHNFKEFNLKQTFIFLVDCAACGWKGTGDKNPITIHGEEPNNVQNIFDFENDPICAVQLGLS